MNNNDSSSLPIWAGALGLGLVMLSFWLHDNGYIIAPLASISGGYMTVKASLPFFKE